MISSKPKLFSTLTPLEKWNNSELNPPTYRPARRNVKPYSGAVCAGCETVANVLLEEFN